MASWPASIEEQASSSHKVPFFAQRSSTTPIFSSAKAILQLKSLRKSPRMI